MVNWNIKSRRTVLVAWNNNRTILTIVTKLCCWVNCQVLSIIIQHSQQKVKAAVVQKLLSKEDVKHSWWSWFIFQNLKEVDIDWFFRLLSLKIWGRVFWLVGCFVGCWELFIYLFFMTKFESKISVFGFLLCTFPVFTTELSVQPSCPAITVRPSWSLASLPVTADKFLPFSSQTIFWH